MGQEQRSGKDRPVGQELSGRTSDKLRDRILKDGDDGSWKNTGGEVDRDSSGFWRPRG